jgi:hypothetical protein
LIVDVEVIADLASSRNAETPENPRVDEGCSSVKNAKTDGEGFEPNSLTAYLQSNLQQSANQSGTESGTLQDESGTVDPDLAFVVQAWTDLPDADREAVLRIVAEARRGGEVGSP